MVNFGYPYNDIVICKDSTDYLGVTNSRATQNSHNPSTSIFENLNFNKCDFITMKHNISSVDWNQFFSTLSTDIYMETFLDKLAEICSSSAPLLKKNCKRISSFHKERKTLMKKRTKISQTI